MFLIYFLDYKNKIYVNRVIFQSMIQGLVKQNELDFFGIIFSNLD